MRVLVLAVVMFFAISEYVFAQPSTVVNQCSFSKIQAYLHSAKTTATPAGEYKYDVKHVHLDIALNNLSVAIAGKAITTARVVEDNFSQYVFELNSLIDIDSIIIDGQKVSFTRDGDIVNSSMPAQLQTGAFFNASVYYHGMPHMGTVFAFQSGMNNAPAVEWGSPVTYTLSEPYNAKDWWPCKQVLTDKIDSADIWITVPDTLKAGSNGVLQKVTPMPGSTSRYEWKTNYPTSYYLLSAAVAAYDDYSFTRTMPDGKQVLVQNYIYQRAGALDKYKAQVDSTGDMLYHFTELFGTYPFYEEKYGHAMAPLFGGMEHQTMTTLHNFNPALVAHELAHQWFGDNVTCATWKDIWLNEGFASYSEHLFQEEFKGELAAYNQMQAVHDVILEDTVVTGSVYLSEQEAENPYRIFDTRLSYKKAGAVIHMLRYLIDDDKTFFNILKQYQQRFADGNATTDQFKLLAEQLSGLKLDTFFNQWIYGEGYPIYSVTWNQVKNKMYIQIEQETSAPGSVPFYNMPVEVKLSAIGWDTMMRIDNTVSKQLITFECNKAVEQVMFDERNMILNKQTVAQDYSLGLPAVSTTEVFVYPNPSTDRWNIINVVNGMELLLTDLNGKVLWKKIATDNYGESIPVAQLARGLYILHVKGNNNKRMSIKLNRL